MFKNIIYLFIIILLFGCGNKKTIVTEYKGKFKRAEIIKTIVCKQDSTQSYSLYLPSNYVEDKSFPIVYCFDPHADGSLAISKFKNAAEKYGYILIGSNNSKNGLTTLSYTLKTLFEEIKNNISFNENLQYTAGFSGGGRVALEVSQNYLKIAGVASNSAGLNEKNIPKTKLNYICFLEMMILICTKLIVLKLF